MSADKHKGLAVDTAYLRLAAADFGLTVNVKWARAYTPELRALVERGDLEIQRLGGGRGKHGCKRVTTLFITDQGRFRLEGIIARHGPEFGPRSILDRVEPVRVRKDERRRRMGNGRERRLSLCARRASAEARMREQTLAVTDRQIAIAALA